MNSESPDNPFRVGGRYRNRKGDFVVLSFSGEQMRIRWDSGEELAVSIALQARILSNMQHDTLVSPPQHTRRKHPNKRIAPPSTLGTVFSSVLNPHADFSSSTAHECSCCHRDLSLNPVVMIATQAFCYRCAKTEYPRLVNEARRARQREARRLSPAQREYEQAVQAHHLAKQQYAAERQAAVNAGFCTDRNKLIIILVIAIPCGILLPIVGLFVAIPMFMIVQPIWDRERQRLLAIFDGTHTPPCSIGPSEPEENYIPDPVVSLHPDCTATPLVGIGYDRNFILQRDEFTCQSCGRRFESADLEAHHLLPRAQRGSDSIRNLVTLCKKCHFHEDWFDHVHKRNQQRISQKQLAELRAFRGHFRA